jgi:hypothetical protein
MRYHLLKSGCTHSLKKSDCYMPPPSYFLSNFLLRQILFDLYRNFLGNLLSRNIILTKILVRLRTWDVTAIKGSNGIFLPFFRWSVNVSDWTMLHSLVSSRRVVYWILTMAQLIWSSWPGQVQNSDRPPHLLLNWMLSHSVGHWKF